MKIVGSSKQDGIPSPDNPVEIKNETVLIITDKEGNKKEMPFKYKDCKKEMGRMLFTAHLFLCQNCF